MFGFLRKDDMNKGVEEFKTTKGAVLLDVRSKEEYRDGHVPGSRHIDVNEIGRTSSLVRDKATPLFVHCLSGGRSGRAVSVLKQMGYTNVKNIGGINSYKGPVEKGV